MGQPAGKSDEATQSSQACTTAVVRCWRNTGDVPLTCVVVQAKAGSLEQVTRADGIVTPNPPHWP